MADLLYRLALIDANLFSLDEALGLLDLADEYGFADKAGLQRHRAQFTSALSWAKTYPVIRGWALGGCLTAIFLMTVAWIWKQMQPAIG